MISTVLNRRNFLRAGISAPVIASSLAACGEGDNYTGQSVAVTWNETYLEAVRKGTLGPPAVARGVAVLHTAMYDAWAPFDRTAVATQNGNIERWAPNLLVKGSVEAAVSYAAYAALLEIFPAQKPLFDKTLANLGYDINKSGVVDSTPIGIGNKAAKSVIAYFRTDGSNSQGDLSPSNPVPYADYTAYKSVNTATTLVDPEQWQPLTFSNGRTPSFLLPHWGKVRTFALLNGAALRPTMGLPKFGSKEYQDQIDQVLQITANLTNEQLAIADYWADGPSSETPPGTWCLIAGYIARRDQHDLGRDIKMYFALGNALKDAGICCWETKVAFNSARPVSVIRALYKGQQVKGYLGAGKGIGLMPGEQWMPAQPGTFITPPFAEFTSGHSTFSSAAAEVLKRFTGSDDYGDSFTVKKGGLTFDSSLPTEEIKLSWTTFTQAADQAGISRLYGGIHFSNGNVYGKMMGRQVGTQVMDRAERFFRGNRQ